MVCSNHEIKTSTFRQTLTIPQENKEEKKITNHCIVVNHPCTSGMKSSQMSNTKNDSRGTAIERGLIRKLECLKQKGDKRDDEVEVENLKRELARTQLECIRCVVMQDEETNLQKTNKNLLRATGLEVHVDNEQSPTKKKFIVSRKMEVQ